MTHFIDTSIFQNIYKFETPLGILQAHHQGNNIYHVYQEEGTIYKKNATIKIKSNIKNDRSKIKAIYEEYKKNTSNT